MSEQAGRPPRATMQDVARLAGVSQSTVSHFVNATRPVHPDTRKAIEDAIKATGYVHDALARSLRTGSTMTIGIAIAAVTNPYFGTLVRRIEGHVTASGRTMLLVDTRDDPDHELVAVTQLLRHRPDAVLLAPARPDSAALDMLVQRGVLTILVDRVPPVLPPVVDAVGVHNTEPMQQLVTHLGDLGHRRIVLLAGQDGLSTTSERVDGYRQGLAALPDATDPLVAHTTSEPAGATAAMDLLFSSGTRPTAVIGGNNQATIAALRWLHDHDLDVPGDVSVASFDDFEWSDLFQPRLTVIRQPVEELADTTAMLLRTRLADPELPSRTTRLDPVLIVRDSTGPVA